MSAANTEQKGAPKGVKVLSLKEAPGYRSALLKLIDATFPKGSPVSRNIRVDEEFALLLRPENAERNLFIINEALPKHSFPSWPVVSAASYRPFEFRLKGRPLPLKCAGIGLVVTAPEHQRMGYGNLIQTEIETRAHKNDGALFSVLWSDLVQFYTKLGYVAAGAEMQWQFDSADLDILKKRLEAEVPRPSEFHIAPLSNIAMIEEIYKNSSIGPQRNFSSYQELLNLPDTYAYGAFVKDPKQIQPKLVAYAFMGKARDLRDTLHEVLGEPRALPHLLTHLVPHCVSGLRVYQPVNSPMMAALEHWLGAGTKNALSFFKVIDGPGLVDWLEKARVMGPGFGLTSNKEGFQLLNRHITFFESQDYGHLLQLFFGPWNISEMEGLPGALQSNAKALPSPLPIYFWGFDSV